MSLVPSKMEKKETVELGLRQHLCQHPAVHFGAQFSIKNRRLNLSISDISSALPCCQTYIAKAKKKIKMVR